MLSARSQALGFVLAAGLCGCSAGSATVSGKVTAEGKEVTGGSIILSPLGGEDNAFPGKPGVADIGRDGTYSLKLEPGKGGLAQRFAVRFTPPNLPLMPEEEARVAVVPYLGFTPRQSEVEVNPGTNVIDIELTPPKN
jgi:hypothetical protein